MTIFAERLRELLERRGWNAFDLSLAARVREQNIRIWLKRSVLPSPRHLLAVAQALGVPVEALLEEERREQTSLPN